MKSVRKMDLIGQTIEIVEASNPTLVGLKGRVVDETRNTIIIMKDDDRKTLIKDQVSFSVQYKGKKIKIDGNVMNKRPEDRIR